MSRAAVATTDFSPVPAGGRIDAAEFAELVKAFNEVTARLESTHGALRREVSSLKDELAEAQARLRRSRQLAALGEMAAGIAHEIRNPLGAIGLTLEALTEDLADRPEQLELCGRVSRAVTRLDAIVGDVLAFARDTRVRPASAAVAAPVLAALAGAEDLVEAHGIDVDLDVDESCLAEIDAPLLEQAFLNLLRNACEAMTGVERRRRLTVELRGRELRDPDAGLLPHAVVRISDTGPGIPDDIRERMFNPFFTTRAEGTGLGLAIVHRIIDAHGGRLDVESSGEGTTITVALPVAFRGERAGGEEDDSGRSLGGAVRRRVRDSAADRGAA
jgi:signal transduction histidine kinase